MSEPFREPGLINKLYRNPRRGMIFGVCAGLAEYFGFDVTVTRVIVAVSAFFAFPVIGIELVRNAFGRGDLIEKHRFLRSFIKTRRWIVDLTDLLAGASCLS